MERPKRQHYRVGSAALNSAKNSAPAACMADFDWAAVGRSRCSLPRQTAGCARFPFAVFLLFESSTLNPSKLETTLTGGQLSRQRRPQEAAILQVEQLPHVPKVLWRGGALWGATCHVWGTSMRRTVTCACPKALCHSSASGHSGCAHADMAAAWPQGSRCLTAGLVTPIPPG